MQPAYCWGFIYHAGLFNVDIGEGHEIPYLVGVGFNIILTPSCLARRRNSYAARYRNRCFCNFNFPLIRTIGGLDRATQKIN